MKHFAFAQTNLRSWRWTTLTALAGISCALFTPCLTTGQALTEGGVSVTVPLTRAADLPVTTESKINTSIATNLSGEAAQSPWKVSLLQLGRSAAANNGQGYEIQLTNVSTSVLELPVGTDGTAIWEACRKDQISEVNIALRISGQVAPAANLPVVHSCAAVSSSSKTIAPGESVVFSGALPGPLLAPATARFTAVVSLCSANYIVEGSEPTTTRRCEVPVVSNSVTTGLPVRTGPPIARVK